MDSNSDNLQDEDSEEETGDTSFDFWSDEGARLFNEMLDEGRNYISAGVRLSNDFEEPVDSEPSEYRDPDLIDPDEETLPPDDMELIMENSFIM